MTVVREGGQQFSGTVTQTDSYHDLALVKINGSVLPTVRLGDSSDVKPGQEVIALGYPLSGSVTVTKGIVSAVEAGFIQTDVAINPGNSGGPLINRNGEVVGVVFLKYYGSGYVQAEGIAFAIAANTARGIIPVTMQTSQATSSTVPYQAAPTTSYIYNTQYYTETHMVTVPATTIYTTSTSYAPPVTVTATRTIITTVTPTSTPPTTSTTPGIPDHVVFTYSGTGEMTLPTFTVNAATCKLVYTADWTGHFAISFSRVSGLLVNWGVTAGRSYETFINGAAGSSNFSVFDAPTNGHWTITLLENPTLPPFAPGAIFSYSGVGKMTLPVFACTSPTCRLVYTTGWSGHLAIAFSGTSGLLVNGGVTAGQNYETYINGAAGNCTFAIFDAPTDGQWTIALYPV